MNSFPIGLNITEINEENLLCKKKTSDIHIEKRILNKIYGDKTRIMSLKCKQQKPRKTKKHY